MYSSYSLYTSPVIEGLVLLVDLMISVISIVSKKCMSSPSLFYAVNLFYFIERTSATLVSPNVP